MANDMSAARRARKRGHCEACKRDDKPVSSTHLPGHLICVGCIMQIASIDAKYSNVAGIRLDTIASGVPLGLHFGRDTDYLYDDVGRNYVSDLEDLMDGGF